MVGLVVPQEELLPENDTQELWMIYGRAEALKAVLNRRRKRMYDNMDLTDIEDIMGWTECRKFGHPSEE